MEYTSKTFIETPTELTFNLIQSIKKGLPNGSGVAIEGKTGISTVRISEAFKNTYPRGYKEWQLKIVNEALSILESNGVNVNKLIKKHTAQTAA